MRALLDINVLIALFDPIHQHHERAHAWLKANIRSGWASCPITQNGFVRIITQPRYIRPVTTSEAIERLREATRTTHHQFWPDDLSITDVHRFRPDRIHGPSQLTDLYLLALAIRHQARFVTFDAAIPTSAIPTVQPKHLVVL
ncbi:MAG TPA: PIN domain-containing protein [Kiritimatiellia bacterium]|nr:PIN domain-containing protein [Kiritimatiellia bacterium]HMP33341.1 PIN domain-containing protein [Kiritimatiellia bacterium]